MSQDPREAVTEFLAAELGRTEEFAACKLELVFMPPAGYGRDLLRAWNKADLRDAYAFAFEPAHRAKLVKEVVDRAEQRAEHDSGTGKKLFRLVVHQNGGERIPLVFVVLPVYNDSDDALQREEGGGDPASPTGTLSMVMRQNRDLHKAILLRAKQDERLLGGIAGLVNSLTKHQSEHQSHLWDRIETLEGQKLKQAELVEEAKTMSHERMIEAKVVESEQDRKDKALDMFETIGKTIVTHLAGSRAQLPSSGDRIDVQTGRPGLADLPVMLSHFMGSLGSEQRAELLERLTMEQKLALAELQKASMAGDASGAFRYVSHFFSKLDEPTVDMLEEVLTGKQKKLLDRIFDLVQEQPAPAGSNGHHQEQATS